MPEPAASGDVDVVGAKIHYAIYGAGDPVILLHGGLGNSEQWGYQVPALVAAHEVIAIDSRGHGRSTRSKAAPTFDMMANDVVAVMDHLHLARASLIGWSDGGEVALKLAITHPERVAKLFIIGTNYDAHGSKPHGNSPTFEAYTAKCRADYAKLSSTPKQFDAFIEWMLPIWRTSMGFNKDQLRAITAPTIVADGDHDEIIVRDQLDEMVKLIPHAKLQIVANTSHFALWQDPTTVNAILVEFLAPMP